MEASLARTIMNTLKSVAKYRFYGICISGGSLLAYGVMGYLSPVA